MTTTAVHHPGVDPVLAPGPHIHFAVYGGEIIVVDARTDRYFGIGRSASQAIMSALAPDSSPRPMDADRKLAPLVARGLLVEATPTAIPRRLIEPQVPGGVIAQAWHPIRSSYLTRRPVAPAAHAIGSAYWYLRRADRMLRKRGISVLLNDVRRRFLEHATRPLVTEASQNAQLGALVEAHIRARMMYPCQVEYLPGSAALAVNAWRRGIPVRFLIGVQKYPFYAHAWVKRDDTVVNDVQDVRQQLAFIVMIPDLTDPGRKVGTG